MVDFGGLAIFGLCLNLVLEGVAPIGDCFGFFTTDEADGGKTGNVVGEDILADIFFADEVAVDTDLLSSKGLLLLFAGVMRFPFSFCNSLV